jgi:lysophospholipase L1-like esterase
MRSSTGYVVEYSGEVLAKDAYVVERVRARVGVILLGAVCIGLLSVSLSSGATRSIGGATPGRTYDVALGDSISTGSYASSPLSSFVGVLYLHEMSRFPGLVLVNLSCPSEATDDMISGSSLCDYNVTPQLAMATSFLRAHRGRVRFVTIDIGINDMEHGVTDHRIFLNLLHILVSLRQADPGVEVVGMNYYDPYLGAPSATPAWGSPAAFAALNSTMVGAYGYADDQMINANAIFGTTPARLCALTFQCPNSVFPNLHPTDAGYAALAKGFEAVIDKH